MKYITAFLVILVSLPFSFLFLLAALEEGNFRGYELYIILPLIPPAILVTLLLINWHNNIYRWIAMVYTVIMLSILIFGMAITIRRENLELEAVKNAIEQKKGVYVNDNLKITVLGVGVNKNDYQYLSAIETQVESTKQKDLKLFPHNYGPVYNVFAESRGCSGREYLFEDDSSLTVVDRVESGTGKDWKCTSVLVGKLFK